MDAYEEAKNEHFESIRINIGHPSYQTQLVDLQSREADRLVSLCFLIVYKKPSEKTHEIDKRTC